MVLAGRILQTINILCVLMQTYYLIFKKFSVLGLMMCILNLVAIISL